MQKKFLLMKKFKNTESAQLWFFMQQYTATVFFSRPLKMGIFIVILGRN